MSDGGREVNAWLRIVVLVLSLTVTITAAWFHLEERILIVEAAQADMVKRLEAIDQKLSRLRIR